MTRIELVLSPYESAVLTVGRHPHGHRPSSMPTSSSIGWDRCYMVGNHWLSQDLYPPRVAQYVRLFKFNFISQLILLLYLLSLLIIIINIIDLENFRPNRGLTQIFTNNDFHTNHFANSQSWATGTWTRIAWLSVTSLNRLEDRSI